MGQHRVLNPHWEIHAGVRMHAVVVFTTFRREGQFGPRTIREWPPLSTLVSALLIVTEFKGFRCTKCTCEFGRVTSQMRNERVLVVSCEAVL